MPTYLVKANEDGGLDMTEYQRASLRQFIKDNKGTRIRMVIERDTPESQHQRGYFEGCIVALVTYYQEGLDHRNASDRDKIREWLKQEFNGEMVVIQNTVHTIAKSTKNVLNNGFLERCMDWLVENYAPPHESLSPEKYKYWKLRIYPLGGTDNYIDYLSEIGILKKLSTEL